MDNVIGWAWCTSRALEAMDGSDDPYYAMCNGLFRTRKAAEKDAESYANGGRTEGATDDHIKEEGPFIKLEWQDANWPKGATMAEIDHQDHFFNAAYNHEVFLVYPVAFKEDI